MNAFVPQESWDSFVQHCIAKYRDQSTELSDNFEQHCSPRESEP